MENFRKITIMMVKNDIIDVLTFRLLCITADKGWLACECHPWDHFTLNNIYNTTIYLLNIYCVYFECILCLCSAFTLLP